MRTPPSAGAAPVATGPGPTTGQGSADPGTTDAVQRALAAEHAAVWALQLVTAFLPAELAGQVAGAAAAHRARRDTADRLLRDRGAMPVAPEAAYTAPVPVTDRSSALALLVTAESDVAAGWRSLIERTDDAAVRTLAAEALTDAAVRATRWRRSAGMAPLTVPLPGAP